MLVKNDAIYEYKILTEELNKRKIKYNVDTKIEKLIEIKYQVIQFFPNAPPDMLNGQLSKNCEDGLELIYQLKKNEIE